MYLALLGDIWLGSIFIRDEEGYKIVLRALSHYKRRLATIGKSPELADAAMFAQVIQQAAVKTLPQVDELAGRIPHHLEDPAQTRLLEGDVPLISKSLESYITDIKKASDSAHPYYTELLKGPVSPDELESAENALKKITAYL